MSELQFSLDLLRKNDNDSFKKYFKEEKNLRTASKDQLFITNSLNSNSFMFRFSETSNFCDCMISFNKTFFENQKNEIWQSTVVFLIDDERVFSSSLVFSYFLDLQREK
jgi:hypothetical protein